MRLDPALEGLTDEELRAELRQRDRVPGWVTDQDIAHDLAQRERNREIRSCCPAAR